MSNTGKADLIELVDALREAAMAYGRHLVAEKKSSDEVKALMYDKMDYAIASLQRQNTSTEGAPSRLRSDAATHRQMCHSRTGYVGYVRSPWLEVHDSFPRTHVTFAEPAIPPADRGSSAA